MVSGLLKPLAVFCSQSQSQRYITTIKSLGDAWRTLAEEPSTKSGQRFTVSETTFALTLKITNEPEDSTLVKMTTNEAPPSGELDRLLTPPRHYRIFPDYGTDFLWRSIEDIRQGEHSCTETEEELGLFPPSVLELYDAWVDEWSDNFKKRCEDTQNYHASVFSTVSKEVAWNVAGYLLAWRIVLGPQVGNIEYKAGRFRYLLERGNETTVTEKFLKDQIELLAKGETVV